MVTAPTDRRPSLDDLRARRRVLRTEVSTVAHWRRLVRAQIDLAVASALLPDRLGIETWSLMEPGSVQPPDHARMAQLVRGVATPSAVLGLTELRDVDNALASYGASVRGELERVTSLLVEALTDVLADDTLLR